MSKIINNSRGFTLVELLIAVVLTGIIGTTILNMYIDSSRNYIAQLELTEIQQNLRTGLDSLSTDLRLAGYAKGSAAEVGFEVNMVGDATVQFKMDLNSDGDVSDEHENLVYDVKTLATTKLPTLYRKSIKPDVASQPMAVAQNIEAVGFAYAFDSNADGELDSDAVGRTHWAVKAANGNWLELDTNNDNQITVADDVDGDGVLDGIDTGITMREADIRAVRIWLLGVAAHADDRVSTAQAFVVGHQVYSSADQHRRRSLVTSVNCRNMGI